MGTRIGARWLAEQDGEQHCVSLHGNFLHHTVSCSPINYQTTPHHFVILESNRRSRLTITPFFKNLELSRRPDHTMLPC